MVYDVEFTERPMDGLFDLRGEAPVAADCAKVLGLALPARANSAATSAGGAVLWLGPERWLIRTDPAAETEVARRLNAVVETRFANAVVVSDMLAGWRVSGPEAADVLAQGCPLDLRAARFPAGSATWTEIFGVAAILWRETEGSGFTLYLDRSYADFVLGRLRRGAVPGRKAEALPQPS